MSRIVYNNRAEWLEGRKGTLGASDVASVMGCGFKTPLELWKEKCGMVTPKDLSDNERVQFGNDAEFAMRELHKVMNPQYELQFTPYEIYTSDDESVSHLSCTPDGILVEKETGRRGVYECKTTTCISKADYEAWNGKIPQGYFCQLCTQMLVTGGQYGNLFALLRNNEGDATIRTYHFEREECEWYIEEIIEKTRTFWEKVQMKQIPSVKLSL